MKTSYPKKTPHPKESSYPKETTHLPLWESDSVVSKTRLEPSLAEPTFTGARIISPSFLTPPPSIPCIHQPQIHTSHIHPLFTSQSPESPPSFPPFSCPKLARSQRPLHMSLAQIIRGRDAPPRHRSWPPPIYGWWERQYGSHRLFWHCGLG